MLCMARKRFDRLVNRFDRRLYACMLFRSVQVESVGLLITKGRASGCVVSGSKFGNCS